MNRRNDDSPWNPSTNWNYKFSANGCPRDFLASIPHPLPSNLGMQLYHHYGPKSYYSGDVPPFMRMPYMNPNGSDSSSDGAYKSPPIDKCPIPPELRSSLVSKLKNERNQYPPASPHSPTNSDGCKNPNRSDSTDDKIENTKRIWPVMGFGKLDIRERDECFVVSLDIPGVSKESIDVSLKPSSLVVECVRKPLPTYKGKFHYIERPCGKLVRTIQLPSKANPNEITCNYVDGVLSITIGKLKDEGTIKKVRVE